MRGAAPTDQSIIETLRLGLPRDTVWTALRDPALIASCVPGARLISTNADQLVGELTTSLGPIRAQFQGTARVTYSDDHTGALEGEGQDAISRTHLHGTRDLRVAGDLTGQQRTDPHHHLRTAWPARTARPWNSVVRAFAAELAEIVARALEARLRGAKPSVPQRLGVPSLLWHALRRWLRGR